MFWTLMLVAAAAAATLPTAVVAAPAAGKLGHGELDGRLQHVVDFYNSKEMVGPKIHDEDPDSYKDHWLGDISKLIGADRSVCGSTDERLEVLKTDHEHYQWTCYLKIYAQKNSNGYWTGTGFILNVPGISGSIMLTSAHCTWLGSYYGGLAGKIVVKCPGYDGVEVLTPDLYADSRYKSIGAANHDIGAVYLKEKFDARGADKTLNITGFPWTSSQSASSLSAKRMSTCGYPGDKLPGTMWEIDGPIQSVSDYRIYYMADTYGGQSGSPVFVDIGDGKKTVVAVHGYGGCPNSAVRLTDDHVKPIMAHVGYRGLDSSVRSFFVPNAFLRADPGLSLLNAQFGCYSGGAESFDLLPVWVSGARLRVSLIPRAWPEKAVAMRVAKKGCEVALTDGRGPNAQFEIISNPDGSISFAHLHPSSGRTYYLRLKADGVDTWHKHGAGATLCATKIGVEEKFTLVPKQKCNL